jgi:hypothetical protein
MIVFPGIRSVGLRAAEPRVLVRGVVDHQVDQDPETAVARIPDRLRHVAEVAKTRVGDQVVRDVSVAQPRRRLRPHDDRNTPRLSRQPNSSHD